ncbi:MAG: SulP family inorganic anion transporter [Candidatus Obscuribacterales bacterium]|nr:SulP family inorganic anion transporter [Candidatus Obscuribacterales bacterium]
MTNATANSNRILGFDLSYLISEWKDMFASKTILSDLWAGLTVALVALPLNLALAIAAGVEPGVGIVTGIISSIITALFGGQKYAITGPAAAMAVVLIGIAETYGIGAIWLVGLTAGILQILSGVFRLGKLISFIPMPVITGFANAIGILVIFNALDDFLGLPTKPIAHSGHQAPLAGHPLIPEFIQDIISLFWHVFVHQEFNLQAIAIGLVVLALAIFVPKWTKVAPGQLVAIVVASIVAAGLHFNIPRVIDIAAIPTSLPFPQIPSLPWEDFDVLFASAITVFMLGSIESLLSASVADGMTLSRRHHSDQELIGQGIANLVTPFFGGIPVTGVIARTAVSIRAGAKTRLASIVHALVLMLLTFALAKQAEQIPLAALGGVLIMTGIRLIEWEATKQIFKASRTEGIVVILTTAASVLIDLTAGVVTGLLLTCGLFIKQMSAVKITEQDYDPDRRSVLRQPVPSCKYVGSFLVDGPLFFGAAERFTETILVAQNLKAVILHMKAVNVMDMTGAETILSIFEQLKRNGVRLILAELPHQPHDLLRRIGAFERLGADNFFKDFKDAIISANKFALQSYCHGCASVLEPCEDPKLREQGPRDCKLRTAMLLNTDQIANVMRSRLCDQRETGSFARLSAEFTSLIELKTADEIPSCLRDTPIEELIKCQNFFEASSDRLDQVDLIVGMCIDYRKQIHLPKNCAYVIRSPGANMRDMEFSIALALSSGIEHMALVVHNNCIMSDPFNKKEIFVETLNKVHGWTKEKAESFFDLKADRLEIEDPVDFALEESKRLSTLFPQLNVVPLLYNVDNDRLFLIKDWLQEKGSNPPGIPAQTPAGKIETETSPAESDTQRA